MATRARAILRDAPVPVVAPRNRDMKDLVLLRHAKALPAAAGQDDRDRPLGARGREDAAAMAGWLLGAGWRPDLVLCSPATRTRETLAIVAATLPCPRRTEEPPLYLASRGDLRARIRAIDPACAAAMIVGHNPGLEELVAALAAGASPARADGDERFPTAAVAWFRSPSPDWRGIFDVPARLVASMTPALLGAAGRA